MEIALFQPEDTQEIAQLSHDTVRKINIKDYSLEQVKAWSQVHRLAKAVLACDRLPRSPDDIYFRNWQEICSSRFTHVAKIDNKIVGFGELEKDGHIDCFYCHHLYQGQGVGSKIYAAIEHKALELNLTHLFTEASITAKPFFTSKDFSVIEKQLVSCRGQTFINYSMEKKLMT